MSLSPRHPSFTLSIDSDDSEEEAADSEACPATLRGLGPDRVWLDSVG